MQENDSRQTLKSLPERLGGDRGEGDGSQGAERGVRWPRLGISSPGGWGLLYGMWTVEEWSERAMSREMEGEGGWEQGDLQEILFGSSKSAPETHYRCPQEAGRAEGPRSS